MQAEHLNTRRCIYDIAKSTLNDESFFNVFGIEKNNFTPCDYVDRNTKAYVESATDFMTDKDYQTRQRQNHPTAHAAIHSTGSNLTGACYNHAHLVRQTNNNMELIYGEMFPAERPGDHPELKYRKNELKRRINEIKNKHWDTMVTQRRRNRNDQPSNDPFIPEEVFGKPPAPNNMSIEDFNSIQVED